MKLLHSALLAAALLLVACEDPVLGSWEYDNDNDGGNLSMLTVHEGGDAGGNIHDELDGEWFAWIFDANWTPSGGGGYEFDMQHDGSLFGSDSITADYTPSDFEFTMECQLEHDGDLLDCVGDGLFEEIVLEWERE